LTAAVLLSACSTAPAAETSTTTVMPQETTQVLGETRATEQPAVAESSAVEDTANAAGTQVDVISFCESRCIDSQGGRVYMLRNNNDKYGEGGMFFIHPDGTFFYCDTGVEPYNAVTGTITSVVETGDHIYQVTLGQINQEHPAGETWTETRPQADMELEGDFTAVDYDLFAEGSVLTIFDYGVNKADVPQEMLEFVANWSDTTVDALPDQVTTDESACMMGIYSEATGSIIM
ncbi:MAG: hypothetical protein J6127_07455, partial [Clostridiales bacterium]|nr:hypothetical protein [Clostridiales bacterium]